MKKLSVFFWIFACLLSCNSNKQETSNFEKQYHKVLIGFKEDFLAEMGGDDYDALEAEVGKEMMDIRYINDVIYVSYLEVLNACSYYGGKVIVNNDTIKLGVEIINDEGCTSLSVNRLTFIIDNPDEKPKIIKKIE